MQSYNHFTLDERESLQNLLKEGKNKAQIAKILKRARSTIGREIDRNTDENGEYNPLNATKQYLYRRRGCHRKYRFESDNDLRDFVCEKLKLFWSPECIVERYKKENTNVKFGYSTIYRAIKLELLPDISEKEHLRRRGKGKYGNRSKFNSIQPDYTIHERPIEIENRERIGDFEGDTVLLKKGGILTFVDRKARYLCASLCASRLSEDTKNSLLSVLSDKKALSLTLDNGSEFAKHREFAKALEIKVYFADPHSPWQRGTNENTNGLLRFFFPKGYDFSLVSDEKLQSE